MKFFTRNAQPTFHIPTTLHEALRLATDENEVRPTGRAGTHRLLYKPIKSC